jgi:tRNA (guanine37-N1)-methyltransferase
MSPPPSLHLLPFHVEIFTLMPDMFEQTLKTSILGRGLKENIWQLSLKNIRDYSCDKHQTVDAAPYGGGAGMVMRADVLDNALQQATYPRAPIFYLSPRGQKLTQDMCKDIIKNKAITIICGRFEGIDQRAIDFYNMREISLGDFVMTGGEIAAMAMVDSCVRLLPGILGDDTSVDEESFCNDLLEYPHYTRPQIWRDISVPDILLSGHHEQIKKWRQQMAEAVTEKKRPDMWKNYCKNNKSSVKGR